MDFSWWLHVKRDLVVLTALDRDALHIYAAVMIQLSTAAVLRRRPDDWLTFAPLAVLELANEAVDLVYEVWPPADRGMQWWASAHDIANTLAMPLLIALLVRRLRPRLAERGVAAIPAVDDRSAH